MIVILDVYHRPHLEYPVQFVQTPEAFVELKSLYPRDQFIIHSGLPNFKRFERFLEFCGWGIQDYWEWLNYREEYPELT